MQSKEFIEQVRRYMAHNAMPAPETKLLVALSGGADSVALLRVLLQLGYNCVAAHCNFHLRGEESMRDERFVRDLCITQGVKLFVKDFDVPARMAADGSSLEMACRDLRYEWFESLRIAEHIDYLAVAHHGNDNIETMLLNIVRGTGIAGAAGIKPVNGCIIRPLLGSSRHDIECYLHDIGQDYVTDSTNAQLDALRNRMRNVVIPSIQEQFPSFNVGVARTIRHMLACHELYEGLVARRIDEITTCDTDGRIEIDMVALTTVGRGAATLLFETLKPFGFNGTQVDEMLAAYDSGKSGKSFLAPCHKAVIGHGKIIIAPTEVERQIIPLDINSTGITAPIKMSITPIAAADFDLSMCDGRNSVCFDSAIAGCETIVLRHWQDGDRFKPFGMNGRSRLVSDLFTDLKIDTTAKERVWLLEADGQIAWVVGCRSSELFRFKPGRSHSVYLLSVK